MSLAGRIYRPRVLATIFGVYFGLVLLLSWYFAWNLPSPWYGPELSRWIYTSYIVASGVFLAGSGVLAFKIQDSFEARVRELNRMLGGLVWDAGTSLAPPEDDPPSEDEEAQADDPTAAGLDEVLETMGDAQSLGNQETLLEFPPSVDDEDTAVEIARETVAQRHLLRRRDGLKRHEAFLTKFLPGPLGVAVGFLGVSAAMLPATNGMLQTSYQLNTTLILGLAYGWAGLAAYFAASILGVAASLRTERKQKTA